MHILLNGIHAASKYRGWGRYGMELFAALANVDRRNRYSVYYIDKPGHRERLEARLSAAPNFELLGLPKSIETQIETASSPLLEQYLPDYDVYHCLTEFPSRVTNPNVVMTIHELTRMSAPKYRAPDERRRFEASIRLSLELARAVIVVSDNTRDELYRCFPRLKLPVHRIWNGVANVFSGESEEADTSLGDLAQLPFVLFVGAVDDPDKNFPLLIEGLARVNPTCSLVVVTGGHDSRSLVEKFRIPGSLAERLRVLVDVPDAKLAALYRSCRLFVFPSYHEGFGLPVVEAMACGAPVLCSRSSSLIEIAESYCPMFENDDPEDFIVQLRRCLNAYPRDLIERAREHVRASFDWEACARAHLEVYENVVSRPLRSRIEGSVSSKGSSERTTNASGPVLLDGRGSP